MADTIKVVSEAGTIGVLVLVLIFVGVYGSKFLTRLLDHLDAGIQAQAKVAANLDAVCTRLEEYHVEASETEAEIAKVLGKLSNQLQTHEGRAQQRHDSAMQQAMERHTELLAALKVVSNGGKKEQ